MRARQSSAGTFTVYGSGRYSIILANIITDVIISYIQSLAAYIPTG